MQTPVEIEIPKSLPQHPWHPSVVYAENGWSGHRFWMAQTPFPPFHVEPYKDRWELPCIHFSDDGLHWKSAGAPIDDLTNEQISTHSYHSDPHLLLKDNVLYCYYRLVENHDEITTIIRKISTDGVHWSKRELIKIEGSDGSILPNREVISPSVVWNGSKWLMYYVDDAFTNLNRGIQLAESTDGVHFHIIGAVWKHQNVIPWHIDVQLIDGMYNLLVHDVDNRTLTLYDSKDGLRWYNGCVILKASNKLSDFWSNKVYRACLVKARNRMQVYFSASDGMASYIGKMGQCALNTYKVIDCLQGRKKLAFFMRFWCHRCLQFIQQVIHFVKKRI